MTGTIKRIQHERGFGFITGKDGTDYFFHHSGLVGRFDELLEDDAVTFDVEPGSAKGPRAHNVERA